MEKENRTARAMFDDSYVYGDTEWNDSKEMDNALMNLNAAVQELNIPHEKMGSIGKLIAKVVVASARDGYCNGMTQCANAIADSIGKEPFGETLQIINCLCSAN